MSDRNLLLKCKLGDHFKPGDIVPAYAMPDAERRDRMIELGLMEWSDLPATVTVPVASLTNVAPQPDAMDVVIRKEKEIEALLPALKAQLMQMTAKATELETTLARVKAENAKLAAERDAAVIEKAGTNNALSQKTVEVAALQKDGVELAACRIERDRLAKELAAETAMRAEFEAELKAATAEGRGLASQVAAANDALARSTLRIAELEKPMVGYGLPSDSIVELPKADEVVPLVEVDRRHD